MKKSSFPWYPTLKKYRPWSTLVYLGFFMLLMFSSLDPAGEIQAAASWDYVRNAAQGYAFQAPLSAVVQRYDPHGVLRIILEGEGNSIQVRVFENPQRLAASQWSREHLLHGDLVGDGSPPTVTVAASNRAFFGDLSAESYLILSPVLPVRWTLAARGDKVYLAAYPAGDQQFENTARVILESFQFADFPSDQGLLAVDFTAAADIPTLSVPYYSQRDPRWICDQIGTCYCWMGACYGHTGIGDAGCFIVSLAMVYEYYARDWMDPQGLDTCLTRYGGYTYWMGCGYGVCAASYQPLDACKPPDMEYASFSGDLEILDADLRAGYPAIAWVDYGRHYLVVTGKQGGLYTVNDPLYSSRASIYPWEILHFVRYHGLPASSPPPDPAPAPDPAAFQYRFYLPLNLGAAPSP